MKNLLSIKIIIPLLVGFIQLKGQNQIPIIDQCFTTFENHVLTIVYDLEDLEESNLLVQCRVLNYQTFEILPFKKMEGDVGTMVQKGPNKMIKIEFEPSQISGNEILIQLSAHDGQPLNIQDLIQQIDTQKISAQLKLLQGKRNNTTDPAFMAQTRLYLQNTFQSYLPSRILSGNLPGTALVNYEANQWGHQTPEKIQILDAHYDSYGVSPGADDNGSGVAGVLEAMRILSQYYCSKTIRYVLFDLEEAGLIGSLFYLNNQLRPVDKIENCINFEMIGYYSETENSQDLPTGFNLVFPEAYNQVIANKRKGDFITNTGNTNSKLLYQKFAQSAQDYVSNLKVISLEVPGNGSLVPDLRRSDHAVFWDKNIPALMITDGANFRNKNYHTAKDSIHYLNFEFMRRVIQTSVATLAELAGIEHAASKSIVMSLNTTTSNPNAKFPQIIYNNSQIIVLSDEEELGFELKVIDSQGRILHHIKINEAIQLISTPEPAGVYFIETILKNKNKKTSRIFIH